MAPRILKKPLAVAEEGYTDLDLPLESQAVDDATKRMERYYRLYAFADLVLVGLAAVGITHQMLRPFPIWSSVCGWSMMAFSFMVGVVIDCFLVCIIAERMKTFSGRRSLLPWLDWSILVHLVSIFVYIGCKLFLLRWPVSPLVELCVVFLLSAVRVAKLWPVQKFKDALRDDDGGENVNLVEFEENAKTSRWGHFVMLALIALMVLVRHRQQALRHQIADLQTAHLGTNLTTVSAMPLPVMLDGCGDSLVWDTAGGAEGGSFVDGLGAIPGAAMGFGMGLLSDCL